MSQSSIDRTNPRDLANATATSGLFHDVVSGASKVLHSVEVDANDTAALRWARELLTAAESKDVLLAMPSANQLAGSNNPILALRRAAQPDGGNPDEALTQLRRGLDDALRGKRDEATLVAVESLRDLFTLVSRIFLRAEISAESELGPGGGSWALSTTTSRS